MILTLAAFLVPLMPAQAGESAGSNATYTIEETMIDLGTWIEPPGSLFRTLSLTNEGPDDLYVADIASDCNCVDFYGDDDMQAGETWSLYFYIDADMLELQPGEYEHSLTVYTNSRVQPETTLRMTYNVVNVDTMPLVDSSVEVSLSGNDWGSFMELPSSGSFVVNVNNTGNLPITLFDVRSECNCLRFNSEPMVIEPGVQESVYIGVQERRLDDSLGEHRIPVEVITNGQGARRTTLYATYSIISVSDLSSEERTDAIRVPVDRGMAMADTVRYEISLSNIESEGRIFYPESIESSAPWLSLRLQERQEGWVLVLEVSGQLAWDSRSSSSSRDGSSRGDDWLAFPLTIHYVSYEADANLNVQTERMRKQVYVYVQFDILAPEVRLWDTD